MIAIICVLRHNQSINKFLFVREKTVQNSISFYSRQFVTKAVHPFEKTLNQTHRVPKTLHYERDTAEILSKTFKKNLKNLHFQSAWNLCFGWFGDRMEVLNICFYVNTRKKKTNHKKPFYSYRSSLATNIPLIDGIHVKRKSNRVQCMKSVH